MCVCVCIHIYIYIYRVNPLAGYEAPVIEGAQEHAFCLREMIHLRKALKSTPITSVHSHPGLGMHSQKQKKRAWTRCAVCDTTPRGSGRARRLRKGGVREGRDQESRSSPQSTFAASQGSESAAKQ